MITIGDIDKSWENIKYLLEPIHNLIFKLIMNLTTVKTNNNIIVANAAARVVGPRH